jgi:proteasome lid subunit RPN8/RPN11
VSLEGSIIEGVSLSRELVRTVVEEARRALPEEACGLLVGRVEEGRARILRAVPCRNEASEDRRRTRFEIDPRRVIVEERSLRGTGAEIVGFYHSHPAGSPVPSSVDREFMALWPGVIWLIVGRDEEHMVDSLRAWGWDERSPQSPRELPLDGEGLVETGRAVGRRTGRDQPEGAV